MKKQTLVVFNDIHGEFVDMVAFELLLKFLGMVEPDKVIMNGDIVDFYTISKFNKDPNRKKTLQQELDFVRDLLIEVRHAAPYSELLYTEGNHEERLKKYLWSDAKALSSLRDLTVEKQLGFEDLGIVYYQNKDNGVEIGDLFIYHGALVKGKSGATAHAEILKNGCSGISGHTHRDGKAPIRQRGGKLCWWENFCMCDLDPEYVKGVADWAQGWSLVTMWGNRPSVEQITVTDGSFIFRGEKYK